jgi:hypothetical protein
MRKPKPRSVPKPEAKPATHIFRVALAPRIHRDLEIGSGRSLYQLAEAITHAFGFDFDHAFGFYSRLSGNILRSPVSYELFADMADSESDAGSVEQTTIADAFPKPGSKMTFLFDYGADWQFRVEALARGDGPPGRTQARVIHALGQAPEQYPSIDEEES